LADSDNASDAEVCEFVESRKGTRTHMRSLIGPVPTRRGEVFRQLPNMQPMMPSSWNFAMDWT